MASKLVLLTLFSAAALLSFIANHANALSSNYYAKTCPNAEQAIADAVKKATKNDKTVPAALLRMHFHDCFVRGCDGSVLLKSTGNNTAEKDGPPNISLHAFYVIDDAKKAVESICPGVVSCADILAVAARDAVVVSGGPTWDVPKGRLDGRISKASETRLLPAPAFNFSQLKQSFSQRGLSTEDLVSLSGGHTLGFSHCSSFQNRIHKFDSKHDVDPNMNPSFALRLKNTCPAHNKVKNAGVTLDSTTGTFDNAYYKLLMQGEGLFSSDQALLTDNKSKKLVSKYAGSQEDFNKAFIKSMIKMSSLTGGQEVRLDLFATAALLSFIANHANALSSNYYAKNCPNAEQAIADAVEKATKNDKTVPAALLRMHFHDCFIRGCDGSVLLESTGNNKAEKDGPPNISLHAFYVIDNAKKAIETMCPGIVSCADILAVAARDAVVVSGGPTWDVPKGRLDGRISKASETRLLPAPTFNFSQLKRTFSQRGLSTEDLVSLSGGHTLGFSHCSSFQNRIHKFDSKHDVDPNMNPSFALRLKKTCPAHNKVKNAGVTLDSTTSTFDSAYYKLLMQGNSLFSSDQALLTDKKSKKLVSKYAESQKDFNKAFIKSMIKMSSLTGGQEVRLDCKVVR